MNASRRFLVSVLLATFLAAWDSTVVGTIGPTIAQHLRGLAWYPWMLTGFMIAATVITPLMGHLSDRYPPALLYQWSIGIFLLGSLGGATTGSMGWFIGSRILQGVGAGGILTLGLIMVGQHYHGVERVRMQGRLSSMWGLAGLLGPTLGGVLTQWLSWRLLFLINVPLGVTALFIIGPFKTRPVSRHIARLDWRGALWLALWLTTGISAITAFQQISNPMAGGTLLVLTLGLGFGWWRVERRTAHPLIPVSWLKNRSITPPSFLASVASGTLYASVLVIPLWLHTTWHFGPMAVGLAILPLPVGWAMGSLVAAPLVARLGFPVATRIGLLGMIMGVISYEGATAGGQWPLTVLGNGIMGVGVGMVIMATLNALQSQIPRPHLGTATGIYNLGRNLGNAIGPGVIGGLILILWHRFSIEHDVSSPGIGLTIAIHQVFWGILVLLVGLTGAASIMVSDKTSRPDAHQPGRQEPFL